MFVFIVTFILRFFAKLPISWTILAIKQYCEWFWQFQFFHGCPFSLSRLSLFWRGPPLVLSLAQLSPSLLMIPSRGMKLFKNLSKHSHWNQCKIWRFAENSAIRWEVACLLMAKMAIMALEVRMPVMALMILMAQMVLLTTSTCLKGLKS